MITYGVNSLVQLEALEDRDKIIVYREKSSGNYEQCAIQYKYLKQQTMNAAQKASLEQLERL